MTALTIAQRAFSFEDYGDRQSRPILLQHGLIASIQDRDLFQTLIDTGVRVIAIARPGYGEAPPVVLRDIGAWAEHIQPLLAALDLREFDVFGISSGAPYAYAIAKAFPELARRLFILSGIPALYDDDVCAHWPYPVDRQAGLAEMQALAYTLFFADTPEADRATPAIRDSLRNGCFGVAQDLRLRGRDWGFRLADVTTETWMRHSRADDSVPYVTAERTAGLLPHCHFEARDHDPHFSQEVLNDFISAVIAPA